MAATRTRPSTQAAILDLLHEAADGIFDSRGSHKGRICTELFGVGHEYFSRWSENPDKHRMSVGDLMLCIKRLNRLGRPDLAAEILNLFAEEADHRCVPDEGAQDGGVERVEEEIADCAEAAHDVWRKHREDGRDGELDHDERLSDLDKLDREVDEARAALLADKRRLRTVGGGR